ncbi:hypothetical protein F4860DRAFT_491443 [Xylaria cubensis]|nr:hypothetical protein F4860DRAFT_491443 [Xylaria cubensis]
MATLPSLLTFGSLGPLPTEEQVLQLQEEFQRRGSLFRPIVKTVHDLDSVWAKLTNQDPALSAIDGKSAIEKLEGILSGTVKEHIHDDMRNTIIAPMTILLQVAQYLSFVSGSGDPIHDSVLKSVAPKGGVQGLCVGLLSAQTVASATTVEDVVPVWCTSVILAFCIGAYVDLEIASSNGNAASVTGFLHFEPPTTREDIHNVLKDYKNIYIPAYRDEQDMILNAPIEVVSKLREDLSQHGATFHEFDLPGKYHTPIHAHAPPKIIKACEGLLDPRFGRSELVRSNVDGQIIPRQDAVRDVLEAILARRANWVKAFGEAAQSVDAASEHILAVGGDSILQSVKNTHNIVRVQSIVR